MTQVNLTNLYEQDFQQWLEETTDSLRNRNFERLDLENLIED
ncbi:protein of unknown function DUF29 [Synechococcus sp. PCC 6312]|nr:DUF29 family protein [Synechococcus sp. PCC 6312]AFY62443.1 protein of unknown function DUF29 [Synechococcus sp. PCC 6312]